MSIRTIGGSTTAEINNKLKLAKSLRNSPIPDNELLDNLGLFLTRQGLSRINFMQALYAEILHMV